MMKQILRLLFGGLCLILVQSAAMATPLGTALSHLQVKDTGSGIPVRGLCIEAPKPEELSSFVKFIKKELKPRRVNTLILRVDYNYQFHSHPELADTAALSFADVKMIVEACKKADINIIPEMDLLGRQSWASHLGKLLSVYPQFDETPWIKIPADYKWPNSDDLYCKSYCPLAPGLHKVVFDLIEELCDVFEADAFHGGMDEVFYIGMPKCPRCGGRDPAKLFAGEVWRIRNHLAEKNRRLWIWGDRLLDGKTTGMGMWEASMNNTASAVDMIPEDIVICDWHYERAEPSAVFFAMKGLDVVSCPWTNLQPALEQKADMKRFQKRSNPKMAVHFRGIVETSWADFGSFLKQLKEEGAASPEKPQAGKTFKALFPKTE